MKKTLTLTSTNHEPGKTATMGKARNMEAHAGTESYLSFTREKATSILSAARSWDELHRGLAEAGDLRLKDNGLVIVDHAGTIAVKAIAVGRDFLKGRLEKRLGVFVPCDTSRTVSDSVVSDASTRGDG